MRNMIDKVAICLLAIILQLTSCSASSGEDPKPGPGGGNPPTGTTGIPQIDNEVQALMNKHNVPGVAVAVTKNGKLVYAKGYGFADKEEGERVSNESLFRIASISKPITGVAIMKLVEDGRISLNDKVFGEGGVLGTTYGTQPYNSGITNITVLHLLQHTSGGWVNDSNDPMFTNIDLTADELISWTLDNRPLNNTPGTTYAYSNFGYSILGRVIEKVTGKTYENYVKEDILQPIGVTTMQLGGNTEADRRTKEVKYYGQNGANPYIYNITRMDAHGGWIASATDLMRLLVHVDGFYTKPDILNAQSIRTMVTPSSANPNYALGWMVNASDNWWHSGSLPGTYTWIARTSGGYSWTILTNTRTTDAGFGQDIEQLMWKVINNQSTIWPNEDLFQ